MAGTLRGIVHLPDFELSEGDVVTRGQHLLDYFPQVVDGFRKGNFNRNGVHNVESENPAVERDFGGHVPDARFMSRVLNAVLVFF